MKLILKILSRLLYYAFVGLIIAFFALPLFWLALTPFNPAATLSVKLPQQPTLDNFRAVFNNTFAVRALFQNNLILATGTMLGVTFLAAMAAYALSRTRLPGRDILTYVLILFSSVVTGTAAMVPIFLIIYNLGLIDTYLGVILVFIGGLLPAGIFIMRDFVDSIPRSYEESALVAGATPRRIFWDVALPLIRPGMMVVAIWAFVQAWGAFLIPFILLRSPDRMPASIAVYSFYTEAGTPNVTLVAAYSVLYTLPVLVLYLLVNWRYGFRFFGGIKR
ncbi:MAG: carbohydrate ABC transporter permease [Ardenticatenaceae bacterium]|nr:carbohydrate ABC transporter permease [Ardenticatenaceae bacterium]